MQQTGTRPHLQGQVGSKQANNPEHEELLPVSPFVECPERYQDEVRSKGLELLADGSYRSG